MGERGQASIEWLGAVALVALVLAAAGVVLGGEAIAAGVVRQVHRALCIVGGGVCDLDRRPCPLAVNATEDDAHVNLGLWRVGRHELILREHRSDGTVLVTYLHDDGVGLEVGFGSDVWLDAAGRQWASGTTARAALLVSLGGGETWTFPDARAADRGMAYLGEGRSPPQGTRAEWIGRSGLELEAGVQVSGPGGRGRLRLDARLVEGTVVDERDGRRTQVVSRRAQAAGLLRLSGVAAEGEGIGEERLVVISDRQGRPLELSVARTGELGGALSLPDVVQPIAGALLGATEGRRRWVVEQRLDLTDPVSLRAAQDLIDALDGPLAMTVRAGDALRARLAEAGVTEARTYDVEVEHSEIGGHVAQGLKLGGALADRAEWATLVDARVRGPDGAWRTRAECLR